MKSKRKTIPEELKEQIKWAEKIPTKDIKMMLLDGKGKTSCGCEVVYKDVCPHGNMGVLRLLMLQYTQKEIEEMATGTETKNK